MAPIDPERHFDTELLRRSLRRRAVRGGVATAAGHAGKVALLLGSTVVLARLLRPGDFGLIAMVTSITGFSSMFLDFGLSAATIQREQLRHDQVSSLFWVNLAFSGLVALVIAVLSPAIAWFYDEPRLLGIALALAAGALFNGLAIQHNAILRRQMRFTALVVLELVATAIGVVLAVALGGLGAGYWSLVVLQVVPVAVRAVLMWTASGWRPGACAPLAEVRSMLAFGGSVTGSRMITTFTRNLDKILIGKFWSAQLLGYYSKAANAIVMPFQQAGQTLARVAVPTLSRLQHDPARYRSYFRTAVTLIAAAGLPLVVFVAVDAPLLVPLVLGDQWLETVPFVRVLAPVALLEMVTTLTRWVFLSLGQGTKLLRWRVFESLTKILGLAIGIGWGALGLAASLALTSSALILPALVYCLRGAPLEVQDVTQAAWRPALAAGAAGAALAALSRIGLASQGPLPALALDVPVFAAVYFGAWLALPGGAATLLELLRLARELRPNQR